MKVEFSWDMVPAYDVIARIRGVERPDEWIIRGNHADGWVAGASDPISGLVSMMEEARAVGVLVKSGWKPKRTIREGVICTLDYLRANPWVLEARA